MANLAEVAADGTVASGYTILWSATVSAPGALTGSASLTLRDGGASGTVRLTLRAAAGEQSSFVCPPGVGFFTDLHAEIVGVGATGYVCYG